ncbi:uncharacterized protein METZ01_LOCUS42333, partial [marine metagenome]
MIGWAKCPEDLVQAHRYDDCGPLAHRVEQGTFNPKVPGS